MRLREIIFSAFVSWLVGVNSNNLFGEVVDKVVATVNGRPITLSQVERILNPIYKQYAKIYKGEELERIKEALKKHIVEQLIENELILQEAELLGVKIPEEIVEEQVMDMQGRFSSKEEFEKALAQEGLTVEEYKRELEKKMIIRILTESKVKVRVKPTPEEIREYYEKHKEKFFSPEEYRIGHLFVSKENKNAKGKIQEAYSKLKNGETFFEVVRLYSEGPRAEKGGDLGYIPKEQLKPELEKVIETLTIGDYSKIIETDLGYHILYLIDYKRARKVPLKEVWDTIYNKLYQMKLNRERKAWVEKLKEKAYITIDLE